MMVATRKVIILTSALLVGIFLYGLLFYSQLKMNIFYKPVRRQHTLLTLFTSFGDSAIKAEVNNNTLHNWRLLFDLNVTAVLFTNSTTLGDLARGLGWVVLPILHDIPKEAGTPILPKMFQQVRTSVSSDLYGFANGDILFDNSLIDTIKSTLNSSKFQRPLLSQKLPFLITGRRTNVPDVQPEEADSWLLMKEAAKSRGKLFGHYSEDYFITNRDYPWETYPPIAIGIRAFDNWIVIRGNELNHTTIDTSSTILAVHQSTENDETLRNTKPNVFYNLQLLESTYGFIDYNKGLTICCHFQTFYRSKQTIVVHQRTVHLCDFQPVR